MKSVSKYFLQQLAIYNHALSYKKLALLEQFFTSISRLQQEKKQEKIAEISCSEKHQFQRT
jgi:hypothetical protein